MDTTTSKLFADINESEDPFAVQGTTQDLKEHKDTTLDPNGTLKSGQDTPHSQDTPHPGQDTGSSPVVKEGAHEEELLYSTELTYEQRKELRMKRRTKKAFEETNKPSKPPKPAHLTKEAIQASSSSPRPATKKPHDNTKAVVQPTKPPVHKRDQERGMHSASSAHPGGSKASDHTHLERQNRRLEEELVKLRDQAKQLEKKLREKDNKICDLKAEIAALSVNDSSSSDGDEKITSYDVSAAEDHMRKDNNVSAQSNDHHGDDSGNDSKGDAEHDSDHHGDHHSDNGPDHHGDHANSSDRHGHQKDSGHHIHKEAKMSNPWKVSKKGHMV